MAATPRSGSRPCPTLPPKSGHLCIGGRCSPPHRPPLTTVPPPHLGCHANPHASCATGAKMASGPTPPSASSALSGSCSSFAWCVYVCCYCRILFPSMAPHSIPFDGCYCRILHRWLLLPHNPPRTMLPNQMGTAAVAYCPRFRSSTVRTCSTRRSWTCIRWA